MCNEIMFLSFCKIVFCIHVFHFSKRDLFFENVLRFIYIIEIVWTSSEIYIVVRVFFRHSWGPFGCIQGFIYVMCQPAKRKMRQFQIHIICILGSESSCNRTQTCVSMVVENIFRSWHMIMLRSSIQGAVFAKRWCLCIFFGSHLVPSQWNHSELFLCIPQPSVELYESFHKKVRLGGTMTLSAE